MKPAIAVLGSLNMDFVVSAERLPRPGETVLGGSFQMLPGGKGANQACAAAKLAHPSMAVRMAGRVGYDLFADHLKASLCAAGVDVSFVHATRSQPTGVALISVERSGQNSIVVAPGANHVLTASDIESFRAVYRNAAIALFQLETPVDAVGAALRLARSEGAKTMLDPAPARPLSKEMLAAVDFLTPNEGEACLLLNRPVEPVGMEDAPQLAAALLALGSKAVVLKLGEKGCYYTDGTVSLAVPGFRVDAVDTTAAGDTFNGALAVALAEGQNIEQALRFANAAGALSVTRAGAQASAPSRQEVEQLLSTGTVATASD